MKTTIIDRVADAIHEVEGRSPSSRVTVIRVGKTAFHRLVDASLDGCAIRVLSGKDATVFGIPVVLSYALRDDDISVTMAARK